MKKDDGQWAVFGSLEKIKTVALWGLKEAKVWKAKGLEAYGEVGRHRQWHLSQVSMGHIEDHEKPFEDLSRERLILIL